MKNRQWDKLTTNKCKQFCNEWCCPCNDGFTGCYANDFYEMLCDNSTTAHIFRGEEDLFDKLQEESYDKMVESYDDPEIYEEFCKMGYNSHYSVGIRRDIRISVSEVATTEDMVRNQPSHDNGFTKDGYHHWQD